MLFSSFVFLLIIECLLLCQNMYNRSVREEVSEFGKIETTPDKKVEKPLISCECISSIEESKLGFAKAYRSKFSTAYDIDNTMTSRCNILTRYGEIRTYITITSRRGLDFKTLSLSW